MNDLDGWLEAAYEDRHNPDNDLVADRDTYWCDLCGWYHAGECDDEED